MSVESALHAGCSTFSRNCVYVGWKSVCRELGGLVVVDLLRRGHGREMGVRLKGASGRGIATGLYNATNDERRRITRGTTTNSRL
jgi:hypothetical protein